MVGGCKGLERWDRPERGTVGIEVCEGRAEADTRGSCKSKTLGYWGVTVVDIVEGFEGMNLGYKAAEGC